MKGSKTRQPWKPGDCFAIGLLDGAWLLGQVLAEEPTVLNSVSCALFDQKVSPGVQNLLPDLNRLFSTIMTTRDLLDSGCWKIVGSGRIEVPREQFPFEALRSSGFIGAKVIGSRNVTEFANAFCGLSPWDDWADPKYLDRLLIAPEVKPGHLR